MNDFQSTDHASLKSSNASAPKKKRGIWWVMKRALIVLVLMMLLLVAMNFRLLPGQNSRLVRPSSDATWITEPLKPNGDVDYLAWANQQARIPPDDNAFVELVKILGPDALDFKLNDQVFAHLGIPPLPKNGDYLERLTYALPVRPGLELDTTINGAEIKGVYTLMFMMEVPFTAEHFPDAMRWFERNDHHLVAIQNAFRKPRYWMPRSGGNLIDSAIVPSMGLREISRVLKTSSMRHLGNHDSKRAIEDQLAILRIGHLVYQSGSVSDLLLACALEANGFTALVETVIRGGCGPADLEHIADEIEELGMPRQMGLEHVRMSRMECLDHLLQTGRTGPLILGSGLAIDSIERKRNSWIRASVAWSESFRTVNDWFDRVDQAVEASTMTETARLLDKTVMDLKGIGHQGNFSADWRAAITAGAVGRGRWVGEIRAVSDIGAIRNMFDTRIRTQALYELARGTIAIERYKVSYGGPPEKLADVVPEFLTAVPVDPYGGAPLVYRLDPEKGYVLYSLGQNLQDDGGQHELSAGGPDLTVRAEIYTIDSWIEEHSRRTGQKK